MCGRYALGVDVDELIELFELIHAAPVAANWNVTPQSVAPVVLTSKKRGGRTVEPLTWGFRPSAGPMKRMLVESRQQNREPTRYYMNARSETVATLHSFRDQLKIRRCVVPASGFYEWQRVHPSDGPAQRVPHYVQRETRAPLMLAGLWNRTRADDGTPHHSFLVLTQPMPNALSYIHNRAPIDLSSEAMRQWLDADANPTEVLSNARNTSVTAWRAHRVGVEVNNGRASGPELTAPIGGET